MSTTIWRRVDIRAEKPTGAVIVDCFRLAPSTDTEPPTLKHLYAYERDDSFLRTYSYYKSHGYVREHFAGPSTSDSGLYELRLTKRTNVDETPFVPFTIIPDSEMPF